MIIGFLDYVRIKPLNSKGMKFSIFFRKCNYIIAHKKSVATNEKQCNSVVFIITSFHRNLPYVLALQSVISIIY